MFKTTFKDKNRKDCFKSKLKWGKLYIMTLRGGKEKGLPPLPLGFWSTALRVIDRSYWNLVAFSQIIWASFHGKKILIVLLFFHVTALLFRSSLPIYLDPIETSSKRSAQSQIDQGFWKLPISLHHSNSTLASLPVRIIQLRPLCPHPPYLDTSSQT